MFSLCCVRAAGVVIGTNLCCAAQQSAPGAFRCINGLLCRRYLTDCSSAPPGMPLMVTLGSEAAPWKGGGQLLPNHPLHGRDFGMSSMQSSFDWVRPTSAMCLASFATANYGFTWQLHAGTEAQCVAS